MGGVASAAWADAVNLAYEAGIVFVAAAGNNSRLASSDPTRAIVYPARFRRVIAACGVMANRRPYYGLPFRTMQGNWGPGSKMATAVSAFTPNMPWAELGCPGIVDMDGSGTSSATPQVAAAAALYLQKHADVLFESRSTPSRGCASRRCVKRCSSRPTRQPTPGIRRSWATASCARRPRCRWRHRVSDTAQGGTGSRDVPDPARAHGFGAAPRRPPTPCWRWKRPSWRNVGADDRPNPVEVALPDPDLPAEALASPRPAFPRRPLRASDGSPTLKRRVEEAYLAMFGPHRHRRRLRRRPPAPRVAPARQGRSGARTPAGGSDPGGGAAARHRGATASRQGTPQPFAPAGPFRRCAPTASIRPATAARDRAHQRGHVKVPWESCRRPRRRVSRGDRRRPGKRLLLRAGGPGRSRTCWRRTDSRRAKARRSSTSRWSTPSPA